MRDYQVRGLNWMVSLYESGINGILADEMVSVWLTNSCLQIYDGPGHCPMISKYGPSLSKAVGPVDQSFLVVKKSHFKKNIQLTVSLWTKQRS